MLINRRGVISSMDIGDSSNNRLWMIIFMLNQVGKSFYLRLILIDEFAGNEDNTARVLVLVLAMTILYLIFSLCKRVIGRLLVTAMIITCFSAWIHMQHIAS